MSTPNPPGLGISLAVLAASAAVLSGGLIGFGGDVPVPVLLAGASIIPAIAAVGLGTSWTTLERGLIEGMTLALQALLILLTVGATIAAWAASGTLATMVDLGLTLLHPSIFLPACLVVCSAVSLAIGSSWATAATVGVALMGVGEALGFSGAATAGAVLSGAYFGDKMSPLSDTTNLAPGIAGTTLFPHIRAMLVTTLPAAAIALIGFLILGAMSGGGQFDPERIDSLRRALQGAQHLNLMLLLPPVAVVGLAMARIPALPALVAGTLVGSLLALWQGSELGPLLASLYGGFEQSSGNAAVDELLNRGGMASMLDTIALILTATAFGGLLERAGFVESVLRALLERVQSARGLVITTGLSAIGVNVLMAEQYLAIVLPGRLFQPAYEQRKLHPTLLSRTLEDTGTVTSALVPWNSCGAYMAATLGVSTVSYVPYAFFNLAMPAVALTWAALGWFLTAREP